MSAPDPRPLTVWLIDDHPLYRDALAALLQARLNAQVTTFCGVDDVLAHPPLGAPDLMVVDFNLQGSTTGVQALLVLRQQFPTTARLVSHSAVEDPGCVQAAIQAGAQAFISKTVHPERLVSELDRLLQSTDAAPFWMKADAPDPVSAPADWSFTSRQRDIVRLVLLGQSNKEMAQQLALAEITVKQHLSKIFEKLGVASRTQAIAKLHRPFD
jgi:DNA-binding NarL/FixJ family response regulator